MGRNLPDGRSRSGQPEAIVIDFQALQQCADFIKANCARLSPPHVPEITLYLADDAHALWHKTEEELNEMGLPPPYWAFAWAGGQALARFVIDNPGVVSEKKVLDFASGSGIAAIAAMKAGARHVIANDIDKFSAAAIALNTALNKVDVEFNCQDLVTAPSEPEKVADVILAGDIFYDREMARLAEAFLSRQYALGARILIGDPGRAYLPECALEQLAVYEVAVSRALEDSEVKRTIVWEYTG
jgi:predicted nicotinamide N-methyase